MENRIKGRVDEQHHPARSFRVASSSSGHPGSKKSYRHITVTPGRGRNAARAATSIRRSAPRLYLPSRPPARPRYQRPSNG